MSNTGRPSQDRASGQAQRSAEFASAFRANFRLFWVIAAGIVNNRSLADDIVQEAALTGLQRLDQFTPGTNFGAWMGQIVRYTALNHQRKESFRQTAATDPARMVETVAPAGRAAPEPAPDYRRGDFDADGHGFDDQLKRALESVNPIARACLLLRTMEGLDYESISSLMDLPPGTAMSHVHRTRQYLRERLQGHR
jgi:RNA polymerase sigma-70 factor (ECF subfamily)